MSVNVAVLAGALALSAAGNASASTISFSFTKPHEKTDISQTGDLSLFNPALGTLTGVELRGEVSLTTRFVFTNRSEQSQRFRATSTHFVGFGTSLAGVDLPDIDFDIVIPFQTLTPGQSTTVGPVLETHTSVVSPLAASWGLFTGVGSFSVSCVSVSGFGMIGGGGNVESDQSTTAGCDAEVIYTYVAGGDPTEVAGPASLGLLSVGLLGLGLTARRRKA